MASKYQEPEDCPLCHDVLTDPAVLSCTHRICNVCITEWRKKNVKQKCPVCRKRWSMSEPPCLCLLHSEPLEVYCVEDEQLICVQCQTAENHKNHTFRAMDEAAEQQEEEPRESLQVQGVKFLSSVAKRQMELENTLYDQIERLKICTDHKKKCDQVSDHIQVQARHTEKKIKEEFQSFHQFLLEEEETRIRALKEEEEEKSQRMKKVTEALCKEMETLTEKIRNTKEDLRRHQTMVQASRMRVEREQDHPPDMGSGALIDQAKHLGNLGFHIWNNMKEQVSYSPVVLDPNTAAPRLSLSEDLTSVTPGKMSEALPENPERSNAKFYNWSVTGSEAFDSGTHTWEVDVKDNMNWQVGVATKSTKDPGQFEDMWGIWFCGNKYKLWTGPKTKSPGLQMEKVFHRIRVKLDFDQGELSFCDAESNTSIHTFKDKFTGHKLTPYFFNETDPALKILPLKVQVTLK